MPNKLEWRWRINAKIRARVRKKNGQISFGLKKGIECDAALVGITQTIPDWNCRAIASRCADNVRTTPAIKNSGNNRNLVVLACGQDLQETFCGDMSGVFQPIPLSGRKS